MTITVLIAILYLESQEIMIFDYAESKGYVSLFLVASLSTLSVSNNSAQPDRSSTPDTAHFFKQSPQQ